MLRIGKQLIRRRIFHHLAAVQHRNLVAHVVHHGQIVADQHEADAVLHLQLPDQVQDLRLYRYIQRAHGLIGHDQLGPADQGAGDGDALALATRELVRILVQIRFLQAHGVQRFDGLGAQCVVAGSGGVQRLRHDLFDILPRIERGIGVLEHHLEVAARPLQLACGERMHIAPQNLDRTAGRLIQRHDKLGQRALAAARFPHDTQALPGLQAQRDSIQRPRDAWRHEQALPALAVVALEIGNLEQRRGHGVNCM